MNSRILTILATVLIFRLGICLEIDKQRRYNTNIDFLQHEAGVNAQKTDNSQHLSTNIQNKLTSSGKRDYVAPSTSPRTPQSTLQQTAQTAERPAYPPKRDYVAPMTSSRPPQGTSQKVTLAAMQPSSPPKRDYVAPQFPALKPPNPGQVKDLVNFFDSKSDNAKVTSKPFSYSSVLQGSGGKQNSAVPASSTVLTQSTPKVPHGQTTKSYSSAISGSSKLTSRPSITVSQTTTRSVTPQLPSVIESNNGNNNQRNPNSLTDSELIALSEDLLRKDTNNAAKLITINYQEKTTSQSKEDKAPQPLLTVPPAVWNIPTIQKFIPLLDNYEKDTLVNEYVTPQERNEENAFMDVIMSTTVIRHLMNFLKDKGYVTPDPRQQRDFLKQLWFGLYSRGRGKISSSGFEHIFVSELRNGEVLGLHNWIYFAREESASRVNYLGYLKYLPLSDKGSVIKHHFIMNGADKPVDTMFIGTSPELEIALYTLCFITRADNDCKLKLGNKDVSIVSHTFRYRSKNLIGSAYPQI